MVWQLVRQWRRSSRHSKLVEEEIEMTRGLLAEQERDTENMMRIFNIQWVSMEDIEVGSPPLELCLF